MGDERLIEIYDKLNGPVEEAYCELRTNIQFCGLDSKLKTIALTSYSSGEGKTTTAINLSISIAKSDKRTLLVDIDLRKPMLMKGSVSHNTTGLSNFLAGMAEFDEIVKESSIPNLFVVSCGPKPPNPTELIGTEKFKHFIKLTEEQFDMVIFDTPPLGSVIDAAIVASLVDGVIIVIEANTIDYKKEQRIKEQLLKAKANISGVILNKIKRNEYKEYYTNYDYIKKARNNNKKQKYKK